MLSQVKTKIAAFLWLVYFLLTISIIGGLWGFPFVVPIFLVGRFYSPAERFAARSLCSGVQFLLRIQPWLKSSVQLAPLYSDDSWPDEPCLYISNHRSHLDAFFLLALIPSIRIFAKSTLFWIPFLSMMMRITKQIRVPIHPEKFFTSVNELRLRLEQGEHVHVFPEMTRCQPGLKGVQDFSLFPFQIAIQAQVKIIPIVFKKTDLIWPKNFLGLIRGPSVEVKMLSPIESKNFLSASELRDQVRGVILSEVIAS